eukprot:4008524-Pyramimonas_sp.AAC.1
MRALKGEIRRRGFDNIQMALRGDVLGSSGVTAASRARDLEAEFSHVAEGRSGSAHVSREGGGLGTSERRTAPLTSRACASAGTTFVCGVDSRVCA